MNLPKKFVNSVTNGFYTVILLGLLLGTFEVVFASDVLAKQRAEKTLTASDHVQSWAKAKQRTERACAVKSWARAKKELHEYTADDSLWWIMMEERWELIQKNNPPLGAVFVGSNIENEFQYTDPHGWPRLDKIDARLDSLEAMLKRAHIVTRADTVPANGYPNISYDEHATVIYVNHPGLWESYIIHRYEISFEEEK